MKIHLSFVPPGGGETDYSLIMQMPEIPRAGDYISIFRPGQQGTEDFIVKKTWWHVELKGDSENGDTKGIWVECEFAKGAHSSENHKSACETYRAKKGILLEFDESMY